MRKERKQESLAPDFDANTKRMHSATQEGRENELIALAYDAVEERIRNGQATSQELVHFLRLGSTKERLEKEKLESEMRLQAAKVDALQSAKHIDELYANAIEAMRSYSGSATERQDD